VRTSRVTVGATAVAAVHLEGSGPAVVLVHGMVVAGRGVMPLAQALHTRGCAVHVPDLPGFGRSDKPDRALDVDGLGRALTAWMNASGLAGAALVGNSFGTQVAAAAGASGDVPVGRLVLLSPTIDARFRRGWTAWLPQGKGPEEDAGGRLRRLLVDALVPPADAPVPAPSLRGLIWREYLAAGPARALSTYRHALRDDLARRLDDLDMPVLVVRAGDDGAVSRAWATGLAQRARHGRYAEVPGVDHDAQFHRPGPLADVIVPFVLAGGAGAGAGERPAQARRTP